MERFAIKIDKKLKANLYKICRLCGIDNPDMVPIISEQQTDTNENACIDVEAEMEMQQKINILLGLSITKDDRMPQTMCCLCVDKINDFYEFREMCYATNAQTRKLLGLKNVKKPAFDIKPKLEVKEESIIPILSAPTPTTNKNGNRKRKNEELSLKEETPETAVVLSKKKLRMSIQAEANVKEETPVQTKKKTRFTLSDSTHPVAGSSKKLKNNAIEDTKLKKEPSPPVPVQPPAVSNKKVRLAVPPQKELATKKSKQKVAKNPEQKEADVKEEIKEEIKEEPACAAASVPPIKVLPAKVPLAKVPLTPKLKFGCNICKERFAAKVNLEAHTRTTHIPKIERYVCTACNEILSKSFDIKNHQLWHKLSKTPYVCGCCGESILNTYAFSRHLREHAFETPPALQVLDRECPLCHTSYATNFLYNIHICAVKTRRCAGCNRLQRNDAEYLKHSAQCAKVYLNYSKHIMPSVEALEDAVRIKNENDVEAAAEEMARISGVSLDMAPVVQLTRLSSPLIMAASHCISTTGLDDPAGTSSKKSGKKGVSKKDLKRVDELLKSTLDALVSIKHEPEVHVDQEIACPAELSDNDDHHQTGDHGGGFDDLHHNDDSDNENGTNSPTVANTTGISMTAESELENIKIKQEIDEANEENSNKIGGGLKLKIKKEHGQLNSSIIEQQKSSEKRAEKRKKKKKHKEKEKDKLKLSKDLHDEQLSQDSIANNNISETNIGITTLRIKAEPQDGTETLEKSVPSVLQIRPHPEATIMTSIPMMQFQIACVSSGVEFNNGSTNTVVETDQAMPTANLDREPEDVKPNRQELDRMLQISHISSGVAMETDETEKTEAQQMDHDGNYDKANSNDEDDYHEESNEDDHHGDGNGSEHEEEKLSEYNDDEQEGAENKIENNDGKSSTDKRIDNKEIIAKKIKKPLSHPKPKLIFKPKGKPLTTATKSRNKACKSTAKPPNMPVLQISAIQSGVTLESTALNTSEFTPIFIKPEPQNRGYSDEQPAVYALTSLAEPEETETEEGREELSTAHTAEEENYISSIDFNNITIKQEKDIEISEVQITEKTIKSFAKLNGIKRKRKQAQRSNCAKDKMLQRDERTENNDENMVDEEEQETDGEDEEENDDDEVEEEEDEEEEEFDEEEDEEMDDEEDEVREYRELEYPPELVKEKAEVENEEGDKKTNYNNQPLDGNDSRAKENINDTPKELKEHNEKTNVNIEPLDEYNISSVRESINDTPKGLDSNISFVIASVCSQSDGSVSNTNDDNTDRRQILLNPDNNALRSANVSASNDLNKTVLSEPGPNKTLALSSTDDAEITTETTNKESHLSSGAGSSYSSDISVATCTEIPNVTEPQTGLNTTISSCESQAENTVPVPRTLSAQALQTNAEVNDILLQLGQPFEITSGGQIAEILDFSEQPQPQILNSTSQSSKGTRNSEANHSQVPYVVKIAAENSVKLFKGDTQNPLFMDHIPQDMSSVGDQQPQNSGQDIELSQMGFRPDDQENLEKIIQYSITGAQIDHEIDDKLDSKYQQHNLQDTVGQSQRKQSISPEKLHNIQNLDVQPETSKHLQSALEISSVRTTALDVTPALNIYPLSNVDGHQISEVNQENVRTIEGVVEQSKDVKLEAQPVIENIDNESVNNDENYEDDEVDNEGEDENELEEDINNDDELTIGNNLEERQNDQNHEVLSQIRPTALALHPYLEDISSSSNSLLSNSLSQTPPPPLLQPATVLTNIQTQEQQRLLNIEETENILNESNDILSRRSLEVAETSGVSAGQLVTEPNLGHLLPPHMPTFNFDNINEIAENNNNANIEREQLQDVQQQQQHHQQQRTTNNP